MEVRWTDNAIDSMLSNSDMLQNTGALAAIFPLDLEVRMFFF
ncbi:hypothetical protein SAMN04487935_3762 [Flavobacterium noncentrifugens]|uniref:Uncharacterized protein n=1 Tax=Flavobacterium noncentrifugens TaxID=1128970 RepID=A0A1G9D9W9_9FLAO|nr:hypothetical protein SAMN04487935_3762 [Flavobacterium noncentrifugens]